MITAPDLILFCSAAQTVALGHHRLALWAMPLKELNRKVYSKPNEGAQHLPTPCASDPGHRQSVNRRFS